MVPSMSSRSATSIASVAGTMKDNVEEISSRVSSPVTLSAFKAQVEKVMEKRRFGIFSAGLTSELRNVTVLGYPGLPVVMTYFVEFSPVLGSTT